MAYDDDELFDDDLEDEGDDEEYEYEDLDDDEEGGEDEGFEEFEDDFESSAEVKVKTLPGMDTFALGWAFFATLAGVCVATWLVLYEVYDWQAFDLLPDKEAPRYPSEIGVLGLGRDDSVSDSVNYVVLDRGTNDDITPGTVIEVTSPEVPGTVMTAIVSEEALGNVSKAWIVDVAHADPGEVELIATDFQTKPDPYKAMRNVWLTRGSPEDERPLRASAVSWTDQRIVYNTRVRNFR